MKEFKQEIVAKSGKYGAYKVEYENRVGCCLVYDPDGASMCFDFVFEHIKDIESVLEQLKTAQAYKYAGSEEEKEYKEFDRKWKERESKWYIKIYRKLEDISIQLFLFDWKLKFGKGSFFKKKNVNDGSAQWLAHGVQIGPLIITW